MPYYWSILVIDSLSNQQLGPRATKRHVEVSPNTTSRRKLLFIYLGSLCFWAPCQGRHVRSANGVSLRQQLARQMCKVMGIGTPSARSHARSHINAHICH